MDFQCLSALAKSCCFLLRHDSPGFMCFFSKHIHNSSCYFLVPFICRDSSFCCVWKRRYLDVHVLSLYLHLFFSGRLVLIVSWQQWQLLLYKVCRLGEMCIPGLSVESKRHSIILSSLIAHPLSFPVSLACVKENSLYHVGLSE